MPSTSALEDGRLARVTVGTDSTLSKLHRLRRVLCRREKRKFIRVALPSSSPATYLTPSLHR
jgi:hypothetical protein